MRAGLLAGIPVVLATLAAGFAMDRHPHQTDPAKPLVSVYVTDGVVPGFLVQARNTSSTGLLVTTRGRCRPRIDGKVVESQDTGGSGSGHTYAPGESWKELWRLVVSKSATRQRLPNPDPFNVVGNIQIVVQLAPGRHTIAFACGGPWSEDVSFEWS